MAAWATTVASAKVSETHDPTSATRTLARLGDRERSPELSLGPSSGSVGLSSASRGVVSIAGPLLSGD